MSAAYTWREDEESCAVTRQQVKQRRYSERTEIAVWVRGSVKGGRGWECGPRNPLMDAFTDYPNPSSIPFRAFACISYYRVSRVKRALYSWIHLQTNNGSFYFITSIMRNLITSLIPNLRPDNTSSSIFHSTEKLLWFHHKKSRCN